MLQLLIIILHQYVAYFTRQKIGMGCHFTASHSSQTTKNKLELYLHCLGGIVHVRTCQQSPSRAQRLCLVRTYQAMSVRHVVKLQIISSTLCVGHFVDISGHFKTLQHVQAEANPRTYLRRHVMSRTNDTSSLLIAHCCLCQLQASRFWFFLCSLMSHAINP